MPGKNTLSISHRRLLAMISPRTPTFAAAIVFLVFAVAGCSSSNRTFESHEPTDIAQLVLPSDRNIPAHPDSLDQAQVAEEKDRIKVVAEDSYEEIVRNWSAQRLTGISRLKQSFVTDYATFWGMDPSILSLEIETGLSGLTKDKALEMIEKRKAEVRKEIQIDVYWFSSPSSVAVSAPTAFLRIDDNTRYPSTRRDVGALQDGFLPGGRSVLYRRITYYFARERDGNDILEGARSIEMQVGLSLGGALFRWNWNDLVPEAESTAAPAR